MPNRHLGGMNKEVSSRKVVKQTDIDIGKYWAAKDIHSHNLPPFDGSIGTAGKLGSSEKDIRYILSVSLPGCSIFKSAKLDPVRLRRVLHEPNEMSYN